MKTTGNMIANKIYIIARNKINSLWSTLYDIQEPTLAIRDENSPRANIIIYNNYFSFFVHIYHIIRIYNLEDQLL